MPPQVVDKTEPVALDYPVENVRKNVRDVTPENALPGPTIDGEKVRRMPDAVPLVLKKISKQPVRLQKTTVLSAGILKHGENVIHIASIVPLTLNQTCETKDAQTWVCGRFARTALRRLIRGRPIECDKEIVGASPIIAHCKIGNRDIGAWLVLQGWARSDGEVFVEQMKLAKKKQRGMWRVAQ